jgi:hypothetical protein
MQQNVVNTVTLIYRLLLHLYPRRFRLEFGAEMTAVFGQCARDAAAEGWTALARVCLREAGGLPARCLAEHGRTLYDMERKFISVGILLLFAILIYLIASWAFRTGISLEGDTFYWPFLWNSLTRRLPLMGFCKTPLLLLLAGLFLLFRRQRVVLGCSCMLAAMAVAWFMFSYNIPAGFEGYRHLESARLNGRVYQLGRTADWDNKGHYSLCECDRWAMLCRCHDFYRVEAIWTIPGQPASHARLVANEAEEQILVRFTWFSPIAGERTATLYRYQESSTAQCLSAPATSTLIGACLPAYVNNP